MLKACVMGHPIKHSCSPKIYQQFAAQFNLAIDFQVIEPAVDQFVKTVKQFQQTGAQGMTISSPFKLAAFQLADEVSDRARSAQSANIFLFKADGKIYADNSDGIGLVNDIVENHQYIIAEKHILLLGAGGAASGVLLPLLNEKPSKIVVANRTLEKAKRLRQQFLSHGQIVGCGYEDLANEIFDLIIDCTSCSHQSLPIPNSVILSKDSFCYDIKYAKKELPFLQWAKTKGANKIANGSGMLIEQAVRPFELWTGKIPDTQFVLLS